MGWKYYARYGKVRGIFLFQQKNSCFYLLLTLIAIIFCTGYCMYIHCPVLFGEDILSLGVVTVGFTETSLVSVWGIAIDGSTGNSSIVVWVPGVSKAVLTANWTPLWPPETGLAWTPLLTGRSQGAWTVICTGAGCRLAHSIMKFWKDTVESVSASWYAKCRKIIWSFWFGN